MDKNEREKAPARVFCNKCEGDGILNFTQFRLRDDGRPIGYIGKFVSARCFCENGKRLSPDFPKASEVNLKYYKL